MAFPKLGYLSILRNAGATITASFADGAFPITNAYDYLPWRICKSAVLTSPLNIDIDLGASGSAAADYIALVNTNIKALGGTVQVFADAVTIGTTSVAAAVTPTYDDVDYREFTSPGTKRYWRVQIAHASPPFASKPFFGQLKVGLKTTLSEYMSPDLDPFQPSRGLVEAQNEDSEEGHTLGAVLRGRTHRFTFATGSAGMARSFLTSDLNAFIDHANLQRPFVFVLDTDDSGDFARPVYLRKAPGPNVERRAVGGVWNRLTVSMPVVEAWMEAAA